MKKPPLEFQDDGRLIVHHEYALLFRRHGLVTCEAIWAFSEQAEPAKALRTDRVTLRFALYDEAAGREQVFYIKRHGRSSWKEYVKPWLQGQQPLLGARHEWEALLAFHAHDLPTMLPVALGVLGERSFLITAGLEGCEKLATAFPAAEQQPVERKRMIDEVARLASAMHAARLHHQDFYLGHLLQPDRIATRETEPPLYLIDLGRARQHSPYFARRWIVKDLAQLNYSAHTARATERLRFLQRYLGRKLKPADRGLVRQILAKTARIARHSRKNGL